MVNKIIDRGKKILTSPQSTILSAALIIMFMIVASRVLGLVRQRVLAHYFTASELSLFFAAFRLPDTIFEVLVFGTFSSAFIPVFSKLVRKDSGKAWVLASSIVNAGLIFFAISALIVYFFAFDLYRLIAPGYSFGETMQIVRFTKLLFLAQGFFVISYVLTGVLESLRRFLVPALAPLFYNLGMILGTVFFAGSFKLMAPVMGVVLGAFLHFLIQLPLAVKLGFRFSFRLERNGNLRKVAKLALPRVIEVSFLQLSKMAELYFSSLVSVASYTYYTFGNTLQLLPVGVFGTSIAKAALPTLAEKSDSLSEFSKTLWKSFHEMVFLILPVATALIVLRIPIVRLVYGTDIFSWEATVQTSMVVSAFALGVVFQAINALFARAFYALHNTKTPVIISMSSMVLTIILDFYFIRILNLPIWGLALAFSLGSFVQSLILFLLLGRKLDGGITKSHLIKMVKTFLAAANSGLIMYIFIKFFDKSVWVKRLSFIGKIEGVDFQKFVLDTRYTLNLLILTIVTLAIGLIVYTVTSLMLKNSEFWKFFNLAKRIISKRRIGPIPPREREPVSPLPMESNP